MSLPGPLLFRATSTAFAHDARVDNTSGELLGTITRGGGVIGLISNLHTCALGCEESPGYVPFLGKPVQIDGFDLKVRMRRGKYSSTMAPKPVWSASSWSDSGQ